MDIAVLGIDLGKTICSLAGLNATGAVVFRRRLQRHRLLDRLVHNRTRLINQARGFLMERGIRIGSGRHVF